MLDAHVVFICSMLITSQPHNWSSDVFKSIHTYTVQHTGPNSYLFKAGLQLGNLHIKTTFNRTDLCRLFSNRRWPGSDMTKIMADVGLKVNCTRRNVTKICRSYNTLTQCYAETCRTSVSCSLRQTSVVNKPVYRKKQMFNRFHF